MQPFSQTYCDRCRSITVHDIYVSQSNYLHSLCTGCGKDLASDAQVSVQNGRADKECTRCNTVTEHIRYRSSSNYAHWFCCSCGKDIAAASQEY